MSGRMSRNKGKRGEREAAKALSEALGCEARRGVQFSGGPDSPDILTTIEGVHFEVKRSEKLNLYGAMEQAKSDAGKSIPVLLHRRNKQPWLFICDLRHLASILRAISESCGK